MERMIEVVFPRAESFRVKSQKAIKLAPMELQGKAIAFVDDGRPNADVPLAAIRQQLCQEYQISPVDAQVRDFGGPLGEDAFDDLARRVNGSIISWGT